MKKTILLLSQTIVPGKIDGLSVWTHNMIEEFKNASWNISIVSENMIGNRSTYGNKTKRNYFVELKRCRIIWNNLKKALKADPSIEVVQSCVPASPLSILRELFCLRIAKKFKKKYVIHFHSTVPNSINRSHNRIIKGVSNHLLSKICKKADLIFTLNAESKEYLHKYTNKTIVVPNFVNESFVSSKKTVNYKLKKAIYVGGVVESKGCKKIIELANFFPDVVFELVGQANDDITKYAANSHNVVLTGPLSHELALEKLETADLFMFLSHFSGEGFSIALLEAMAKGLPCLVTDWAANKDMIECSGGEVVDFFDIETIKTGFERMLPYDKRVSCSMFNIAKVKKEYTSNVVVSLMIDCYEKIV